MSRGAPGQRADNLAFLQLLRAILEASHDLPVLVVVDDIPDRDAEVVCYLVAHLNFSRSHKPIHLVILLVSRRRTPPDTRFSPFSLMLCLFPSLPLSSPS
eukprot:183935-Rhodomonas_salina.1